MTREELIKDLFVKYGLVYDKSNPKSKDNDIFIQDFRGNKVPTITRGGIQKIEVGANIKVRFDPIAGSCGLDWVIIRAIGTMPVGEDELKEYETFASATSANCKSTYYAEMAEKRARSRVVLALIGLYQQGFYGQDEIKDDDDVKQEPQVVKKPIFKTQATVGG